MVNNAVHWTQITLRFIFASEFGRRMSAIGYRLNRSMNFKQNPRLGVR